MNIVKTEKLCKWYGTGDTRVDAVCDIDLTIEKGEFLSVVGQSGSGKSTLLHLIGAVDQPSSGKVYIEGEDLSDLSEGRLAVLRRRKIGFVFQFYNLLPVLTVQENIALPLLIDKQRVDHDSLEELLHLLGLVERRHHFPSQLSGGQQQRVSIGRALFARPSLLLADEPTGNLDNRNSRDILDLLKLSSRRFDQTLMLVTHDRDLACEADRILSVDDGRIIRDRWVR